MKFPTIDACREKKRGRVFRSPFSPRDSKERKKTEREREREREQESGKAEREEKERGARVAKGKNVWTTSEGVCFAWPRLCFLAFSRASLEFAAYRRKSALFSTSGGVGVGVGRGASEGSQAGLDFAWTTGADLNFKSSLMCIFASARVRGLLSARCTTRFEFQISRAQPVSSVYVHVCYVYVRVCAPADQLSNVSARLCAVICFPFPTSLSLSLSLLLDSSRRSTISSGFYLWRQRLRIGIDSVIYS